MAVTLIDNRYVVRRQIGTGGQGEVYEVFDNHEHDVAALKLLRNIAPGREWVEAQILRHLSDAHILPIRNAAIASGQPYLVTELATHGTLEHAMNGAGACGLLVDDVVRLTRQACHGIARAHDHRLLHNDIKPGNLFLNGQGECLVGDFGGASLIPEGATTVTPAAATPATSAPEVALGWPAGVTASVRSDVYSLGATAYWLLAGRRPYEFPEAADFAARMAIVAAEAPPRLGDLAPHVPKHVAAAVERAMARDPRDRYDSVTAFASALGERPAVKRRWKRTDEHPGHFACWRGEPQSGGSIYVTCLEQGSRPTEAVITTRHLSGGNRISAGCRSSPMRNWPQAIRSVMRKLS